MQTVSTSNKPILVLGGTGNSGRRIVERLRTRGLSVRVGSRSANPPFVNARRRLSVEADWLYAWSRRLGSAVREASVKPMSLTM